MSDDRLREIEDMLWDNTCVSAFDLEAKLARKRYGRVEVSWLEAEHIVAQVSALQQALHKAREENARLKQALQFYADPKGDNRLHFDVLWLDRGEKARAALGEQP